ncbi:MAG: hypothetical protein ACI8QZ_002689 [Chlamydiales bacterium]|jgi:hypothetical protein
MESTPVIPAVRKVRTLPLALCLLFTAFVTGTLVAAPTVEKKRDRDLPSNAPTQCPYCKGDPDLMRAAGVVSHGGFEVARTTTAGVDEMFPETDVRWIESRHFEIGIGIGTYKVSQKERDKFRAELTQLAKVLPAVDPKEKNIDPWLRAHLYVQRMEELWERILKILQVDERAFPDGRRPWDMTTPYRGEGPYLGQKGKYEILVWPSEGIHYEFLNEQFGLRLRRTQRYNVIERDSLILLAHIQQEGLRYDEALHGHLAFNMTIQFLDGYKHYSYDSPVWMLEGMAHWIERSINPNFNSFDASEGGAAHSSRKTNWEGPTRKIAASSKAISLAQLVALRRYADFELAHHYTCWSMIDFLMREHPDFLAELWAGMKGITDQTGVADGSELKNVHRGLFKSGMSMSYAQFDTAWRNWVAETYSAK